MNPLISKSLSFLRYANFIVILGSGITWTGLSYELTTKFDDPHFMAFMQVLSVIAGFLGPFLALWFHSRSQIRSIIIGSELIATACCIGIFFLLLPTSELSIQTAVILGTSIFMIFLSASISGLFIEPLYANLIEKRDGSDKEVGSGFATFACYGILSKLGGMSLGPFVFEYFKEYSLMLNASTFLFSACLIWLAFKNVPSDIRIIAARPEEVTILRKSTWSEFFKLSLLETAIANSLIFVVVLAMSTQAMVLQATPTQLSLFWFGATGCAFLSHFLLGKFPPLAKFLFSLEKKWGFIQVIPICIGLLTRSLTLLLLSQWAFSLLNPLTTNQSRAEFYRVYGRNSEKALDAYAMRNILTNLFILSFSIIVSLIETETQTIALTIAIMSLIVLRWGIAARIGVNESSKEVRV